MLPHRVPSFPNQSPISDINQRNSGRRQLPALLRHGTASRSSFFINESPLVVFLAQLRGMRVSGVEGSDMDNGGSSSAPGSSADTFKPLQFGRKIYADDDAAAGGSSSKSSTVPALPEVRPSAATGKKAKCAAQGFGQSPPPPPPKCQVEGCDLDLKGSKSYYCRHKVCGMHSKSPKVIVAGLEQRFCQQCSRVIKSCGRRFIQTSKVALRFTPTVGHAWSDFGSSSPWCDVEASVPPPSPPFPAHCESPPSFPSAIHHIKPRSSPSYHRMIPFWSSPLPFSSPP
ncbi:Squamosa promoter-binding-like protein 14 [Platanthera zijinensis]|uniref:Squamosa promoter-binding-like protein 14 n=1 Tax=Platanthera zijinensis TaxID=2320716 RepID=A0AAP0C1U4_9ASPA